MSLNPFKLYRRYRNSSNGHEFLNLSNADSNIEYYFNLKIIEVLPFYSVSLTTPKLV